MQVILAAMGGGAPGTMTAECAGALAAANASSARGGCWRCPRAARRAEWKQRPQEVQAVLEARGYASCALWRTAAIRFIRRVRPAAAVTETALGRALPGISSV
ncbi:hypothetical protein [Ruthenibacterium lactatiformans]|uniref:hypothetical protein n=1 Tax=Ruthenibacterium lactatiformans TaxID=1550024 RepID=UPI0039A2A7B7